MTLDDVYDRLSEIKTDVIFPASQDVDVAAGLCPLAEISLLQSLACLDQALHLVTQAKYHQAAASATLYYGGY